MIIQDESENNFLKKIIRRRTTDEQYWIGLRRLDSRDIFEWVDGSSVVYGGTNHVDPWKTSEPNRVEMIYHEC